MFSIPSQPSSQSLLENYLAENMFTPKTTQFFLVSYSILWQIHGRQCVRVDQAERGTENPSRTKKKKKNHCPSLFPIKSMAKPTSIAFLIAVAHLPFIVEIPVRMGVTLPLPLVLSPLVLSPDYRLLHRLLASTLPRL